MAGAWESSRRAEQAHGGSSLWVTRSAAHHTGCTRSRRSTQQVPMTMGVGRVHGLRRAGGMWVVGATVASWMDGGRSFLVLAVAVRDTGAGAAMRMAAPWIHRCRNMASRNGDLSASARRQRHLRPRVGLLGGGWSGSNDVVWRHPSWSRASDSWAWLGTRVPWLSSQAHGSSTQS